MTTRLGALTRQGAGLKIRRSAGFPPRADGGKNISAASTAVLPVRLQGSTGVTFNNRLVTGGAALAAFVEGLVGRHGALS